MDLYLPRRYLRISESKELDWISNSALRLHYLSVTLSTHPRTLFIDVNFRCYLVFPSVNHMPHQHLIIFVGELIQTLRRKHISNLVYDNNEFSENTCLYASYGYRLNFFLLTFFFFFLFFSHREYHKISIFADNINFFIQFTMDENSVFKESCRSRVYEPKWRYSGVHAHNRTFFPLPQKK